MNIEQFTYGPEPRRGLQYRQTDGLYNLLPEEIIIHLQNLKPSSTPIQRIHATPDGLVASISFVKKTQDDLKRETVANHTFIIRLSDMVNHFTGKLEPYNIGRIRDVTI